MKHDLRSKSVSTNVSEAELRVLESRAERAGLTLSEWVAGCAVGFVGGDGHDGSGAGRVAHP